MSNWIDFDMLILELEHHKNNAARIIEEYKEIDNPTDGEKFRYKEAIGVAVIFILEYIMAWCKDSKFSSDEVDSYDEGYKAGCSETINKACELLDDIFHDRSHHSGRGDTGEIVTYDFDSKKEFMLKFRKALEKQ